MRTGGFIYSRRSGNFPERVTLRPRGTLGMGNSPQPSKTLWWEQAEHQGLKRTGVAAGAGGEADGQRFGW